MDAARPKNLSATCIPTTRSPPGDSCSRRQKSPRERMLRRPAMKRPPGTTGRSFGQWMTNAPRTVAKDRRPCRVAISGHSRRRRGRRDSARLPPSRLGANWIAKAVPLATPKRSGVASDALSWIECPPAARPEPSPYPRFAGGAAMPALRNSRRFRAGSFF